jgi:ADP-ribose pyrophosphatase YjhB (NUDIX family)
MIKNILLKIWRVLPLWIQVVLSRFIRPLFQVFAAAVIFGQDDKILLVKLTYQRFHPWGLPGGSLDYGEIPENGVIREVWEEMSLDVVVEKLLLVKTWKPDKVGLYYLCRVKDGAFYPSDEVSEYGHFSLADLPDVRPVDVELITQIYKIMGFPEHELA